MFCLAKKTIWKYQHQLNPTSLKTVHKYTTNENEDHKNYNFEILALLKLNNQVSQVPNGPLEDNDG